VTYVSFRATAPPPANTRFGKVETPGLIGACTNPGALGGGSATLHAYLAADGRTIVGTSPPPPWVIPERRLETPWVSVPDLLSARCTSNEHATYLEITVNGDTSDPRTDNIYGDLGVGPQILADWGLHLIDVNLAMGNLVEIVREQSRAWTARRAR
jgi:hypothetical protein